MSRILIVKQGGILMINQINLCLARRGDFFLISSNVTAERIVFENNASHYIEDNSTCIKIQGSTSLLEIC